MKNAKKRFSAAAWCCIALNLIAWIGLRAAVASAAQAGYEPVPVGSASKILPPALLSGPYHRVQERVTSDGIVNIYKIDSMFGTLSTLPPS